MGSSGLLGSVARAVEGSTITNTIVLPPAVPVFFQRSPGHPGSTPRGIAGLDFQVILNGAVIQNGRTGPDGRVDVRVPIGGTSKVQLLVNGNPVADYDVTLTLVAFDPVAPATGKNPVGQQQRLRHLGYQIGHNGATGDGVDTAQVFPFERSLLDFQVDNNLLPDAIVGKNSTKALTAEGNK